MEQVCTPDRRQALLAVIGEAHARPGRRRLFDDPVHFRDRLSIALEARVSLPAPQETKVGVEVREGALCPRISRSCRPFFEEPEHRLKGRVHDGVPHAVFGKGAADRSDACGRLGRFCDWGMDEDQGVKEGGPCQYAGPPDSILFYLRAAITCLTISSLLSELIDFIIPSLR